MGMFLWAQPWSSTMQGCEEGSEAGVKPSSSWALGGTCCLPALQGTGALGSPPAGSKTRWRGHSSPLQKVRGRQRDPAEYRG